jgi:predicted NAD/FAD-dependent oxidoreductase
MSTATVGIMGGGIAGTTAAKQLAARGVRVALYERSPQLGGRLGGAGPSLLAGAGTTYVKAKSPLFVAQVERWLAEGVASEWRPSTYTLEAPFAGEYTAAPAMKKDGERWFCGSPWMARLAGLTAAERGLVGVQQADVSAVSREGDVWRVRGGLEGAILGEHSALICAVPLAVARTLLPAQTLERHLPSQALEVDFEKARYAAAFRFEESLALPFAFGVVPAGASITVLLNDSSRMQSTLAAAQDDEVWVVQTSTDYGAEKLGASTPAGDVARELLTELQRVLGGQQLPECVDMEAVAWVYGDADLELEGDCVWDAAERLAIAGDWCRNGRVEGAWLSGRAAAQSVLVAVEAKS